MEKQIYDSYIERGWKLFKLYKPRDGEQGNAVKGLYATPKGWNDYTKPNANYSETAIYGGIPPKDMVVLDVDVKNGKVGEASLKKFLENIDSSFYSKNVITPSGGYHIYTKLDEDEFYKKYQSKYPDIDFIGHQKEFVVLGGQDIEGYGTYELLSLVDNNFGRLDKALDIRIEHEKVEYDEVDDVFSIDRPQESQMIEWLEQIDPDIGYDEGWRDVVMALNSWDTGGERGFELLKNWNAGSTIYEMSESDLREKYNQNKASTKQFYNKLVGMANKNTAKIFRKAISEAKDKADLFEKALPILKHSTVNNEDREALGREWQKAFAKMPTHPKYTTPKKEDVFQNHIARVEVVKVTEDTPKIFMVGTTNYILEGKTLLKDIAIGGLKKVLRNMGYDEMQTDAGIFNTKQVVELKETPDYLIDDDLEYELVQVEERGLYNMIVKHNPLYGWEGTISDEDIQKDFFQDIWQGKVDDIVKIIALSIKTKERKLNRLMLVAPSNTGKSEIFNHLGFQKIVMKRLVSAMNGDKGVGSQVINGLKKSGFMLIDEANTALTSEIKDMDKELHIDQFGVGGTQIIQLMFTALTSTHSTATRNASDELYNRFLQVELLNPKKTLNDSLYFREDRDKYTEVVKTYMINLFLETLTNKEGKNKLHELQEKYRLPLNNDLDEFLYEVSEKVIHYIKTTASYDGNIIVRAGEYFISRKKDLSDMMLDMLKELPSLDHGKYAEKLMTHFIKEDKKSIRIGETIKKLYPISLVTFTNDKEQQVIDMFDDLDLDDL